MTICTVLLLRMSACLLSAEYIKQNGFSALYVAAQNDFFIAAVADVNILSEVRLFVVQR